MNRTFRKLEGGAVGLREWAHNSMIKRAIAARERGDSVYVHQLANANGRTISTWVNKIESVGWKLEGQTQAVGSGPWKGKPVWIMTFRRADATEETPQ